MHIQTRHRAIVAAALVVLFGGSALASADMASAREISTAGDDSYAFSVGSPGVVPAPGILLNDNDPGGLLGVQLLERAREGTVSTGPMSGRGGFTYTPNARYFAGEDHFTYCLSDGGVCVSNVATVRIKFVPPVPSADFYSTARNAPLRVPSPGPLLNDSDSSLFWSATTAPLHGALSQPAELLDGFVYSPEPGFVGIDQFDYCLSSISQSPTNCLSDEATVSIRVGGPAVTRIAGMDRYEGAALVARQTHPGTSVPMFIASGENFADALSAGPAAVKAGAPLLLARRDELPAATASEITRLQPQQITVVGGPATISESVLGQIRNLVPTTTTVTRVSGIDRYEVSRNLAQRVFGSATHGYVATGTNFPDALSAGAAAGSKKEPLVLVDGSQGAADAATLETFRSLRTMSNTVVGGGGSVSAGVEGSLNAVGSVNRLAGVDRYETSVAVNQATLTRTLSTVYLATGLNYPDALVGSVIAGRTQSPLYVVPGTCVPQPVLDEIARLGATSVVLLGGTASLSPAVADLVPCP